MMVNIKGLLKIRDDLIKEFKPKSVNDNVFISRDYVGITIMDFFDNLTN